MSMNLIFDVKGGSGCVDFPFQTPTELTKAVLRAEGNEARLKIIRDQLVKWQWKEGLIKSTMSEIEALMESPNLELSEI